MVRGVRDNALARGTDMKKSVPMGVHRDKSREVQAELQRNSGRGAEGALPNGNWIACIAWVI